MKNEFFQKLGNDKIDFTHLQNGIKQTETKLQLMEENVENLSERIEKNNIQLINRVDQSFKQLEQVTTLSLNQLINVQKEQKEETFMIIKDQNIIAAQNEKNLQEAFLSIRQLDEIYSTRVKSLDDKTGIMATNTDKFITDMMQDILITKNQINLNNLEVKGQIELLDKIVKEFP